MNEEFLVEPKGFNSALELKYLLEKFGFFRGRFIGKFPKDWQKQIYHDISSLPDLEQARIKRLVEKSKDSLVPSGQPFEPSKSWLDNAHQQIEQKRFSGVVAAKPNQWGYPDLSEVDEDYLKGGHDVRILGQAEYYTDVVRRLLQLSYEIVLVDPYLHLDKTACENVMASFLETAQQGKGDGKK